MLSLDGPKTSRDVAWDHALTSQMNVLYYQRKVGRWITCDVAVRLLAAIAASATIVTFLRANRVAGVDIASLLALVSAVASIGGITLRIPDKVRELGVLLAEYTSHQSTFERFYQFGCTDDELQLALKAFAETEQREAKDHPDPDQKLLDESQAIVLRRIGAAT